MQNKKAYELVTTDTAENTRHSPHNGFNKLLRALPGDQGFVDTVADGLTPANLTPTSRRQDHTLSPSASTPFVKGASTSTASRSAYRDDREPPLLEERDGGKIIRKSEVVKL
jgi:hypothetical protein